MAQEVGVAYVTLLPSGRGFGKSVEGQIDSAVAKSERKTEGFFSKVGTGIKRVGLGVAALVGTVGTLAVGGGISRALNIEDAQAKLKGLGHDTKSVEAIMTNALASVKGTAFGLDAAATTAASAVASGIKPGQELERYLRLTADAATIAGISMEEMGSIINKVQAKGVAQMDDLNRLTERGVPILQMLADEYGVTADEMSSMVSRGEVDAERFRKALEDNVSGAALASGDTTRGAFANMMAALSRLGLVFVEDALGGAKQFFNEMTVIFDGLGERFGPWVDDIKSKLSGMFEIEGMGDRFLEGFDRLVDAISNGPVPQLLEALSPLLPVVADAAALIGGALGDAFYEIGEALAPVLPLIAEDLANALVEIIPPLADLLVALLPLVGPLAEILAAVAPIVTQLVDFLLPAIEWLVDLLSDQIGLDLLASGFRDGKVSAEEFVDGIVAIGGPIANFIIWLLQTGVQLSNFVKDVVLGAATIWAAIRNAFSNVMSFASTAWSVVSSVVSSAVGTMISVVQGLPGQIMGALSGAATWLVQTGRDIIQGLINGVASMIGSAVSAVKNVGGAMLDGVKSFLGIHSPSRVFRDQVGKMVGLGLLEGIEDQAIAGRIDTAVNHMVAMPEDARSASFPGSVTLVDEDGSILARARVVADRAIDSFQGQMGAAMRYAQMGV
ncbi:tape measure protein [Leucobacter allii]|uniref:Tape measure protein n=1 Tax=Leucobacter allii TaxID=2932247 RepID=A0ABY4FLY0_9MICO|nr:tape measure protein [Leucobacter allii]UOQ57248.1 tape measure protein [Leucobacter allii]